MEQAKSTALMLLVWAALLVWHLAGDRLGCPAAALLLALTAGLLALSGTEVAFYRRHAFVSHYLQPGGFLFRFLGRRILMMIREGIKSLFLALVLLVAALGFEPAQWGLLLADVLVLSAMLAAISSSLSEEVREPYPQPMARHWAGRANAVMLWLAWALLMYLSPQENYSHLRWEEVLAFSAAQPAVGCDALGILARLAAVAEALAMWSAQHLLAGLKEPAQVLMAWAVFLAAFGASFLLAWTYSRALTGVLARPWNLWRQHSTET
jgi:hypothetical protein